MKVADLTIDLVRAIERANSLTLKFPLVVVFRNTGMAGNDLARVEDTGDNLTDVILCCDADRVVTVARGRSIPHKNYLLEQEQGVSMCNYLESQYAEDFWTMGNHLGYTGLVQTQSGNPVIHRTRDRNLGNQDDYIQYGAAGKVGDNFHGYAPYSAGCTTVYGNMSKYPQTGSPVPPNAGDWGACEAWFSGQPSGTLFSALWLEHEDLTARKALRIGSKGQKVSDVQARLGLQADGAFGPQTFLAVRQKALDGIVTAELANGLGVSL